jgi:hypothetical protein
MATSDRTIKLPEDSYALLAAEAQRRGIEPDAVVDELVRADLGASRTERLDAALEGLAELREKLPEIDAVVLAGDARAELERRGH